MSETVQGPAAVPGLVSGSNGALSQRLQELLSQSLADQIAERRGIADALTALTAEVRDVRQQTTAVVAAVAKHTDILAFHTAGLAELGHPVRALPEALSELRSEITELAERISTLQVPAVEQIGAEVADRLAAERLAARDDPTTSQESRPSDGQPLVVPKSTAVRPEDLAILAVEPSTDGPNGESAPPAEPPPPAEPWPADPAPAARKSSWWRTNR